MTRIRRGYRARRRGTKIRLFASSFRGQLNSCFYNQFDSRLDRGQTPMKRSLGFFHGLVIPCSSKILFQSDPKRFRIQNKI